MRTHDAMMVGGSGDSSVLFSTKEVVMIDDGYVRIADSRALSVLLALSVPALAQEWRYDEASTDARPAADGTSQNFCCTRIAP